MVRVDTVGMLHTVCIERLCIQVRVQYACTYECLSMLCM